jgi:uncharacterized protein (TIGR02147 family)
MPDIFLYSDYKKFLLDFYDYKKAHTPGFSYRLMSQKAGVKSSAFFKLVIEGKRKLSKSSVLKTTSMMDLSKEEGAFFENLVFFNQAETLEEKNHFFEKMVETQKRKRIAVISENQMNYFSEWYHPVIRELVVMPDFNGDFERLSRDLRPSITAKQVETSVELLLRLGFLKRDGKKLLQTEPSLSAGSAISDFLIVQYQIKHLRLAIESFDRFQAARRMSSTTTMALSSVNLKSYFQKMREFRSELQELARNEKQADVVYSLGMNFFPLSSR